MNLSLQDPFAVAKEYPETLTHTLQYGHCVTFQFNHKGDYLASGLNDGSIVIYDLSSSGSIVCHIERECHVRPITSISWSKCGRYLLTASQDWDCKLWDLSKVNNDTANPLVGTVTCDGPVWGASINPRNPLQFIASLYEDLAIFVDFQHENPLPSDIKVTQLNSTPKSHEAPAETNKHLTLVSIFTPDGTYIFLGTNKGWLNVISTDTLTTVHSIKITNSNIKNIIICPNGRKLAINSSDRIIRQMNLPDLINVKDPEQWDFEIEHKYQDVVNKLQWNSVSFNHNGEFLVASTFGTQSSQDLYIWETAMGSLIKILEGSSEELIEVKWNYPKCMIGSNGIEYGIIYLWSVPFPQKWSALAPDFVEIEENIEYEEREDEFDIIDQDILDQKRLQEEDSKIDIITKEPVDARGFDMTLDSFIIPINYEKSIAVE